VNVVSSPDALGLLADLYCARCALAVARPAAVAKADDDSADGEAGAAFPLCFNGRVSVAGSRGSCVAGLGTGTDSRGIGFGVHGRWRILLAAIVGAATLGGLQWLNLRRMGRSLGKAREFMQVLAERILPQSPVELLPYLGLAVTAGLCEEFLYRGFAMAALTKAGLPVWGVVLLSSVLFGLAHLYQGRGGIVSTLVVGTVFGTARIAYDGLVPVMLWHFAVDAVAGVAGPKYLVRAALPRVEEENHSSTGL
jgi:membrane protease YdiL (CAAX protease family)